MEQGFLIDTNIAIGYLDNKLPEPGMQYMHGIIDQIPNISVITKIELLRFDSSQSSYKILLEFTEDSVVMGLDEKIVERTIDICKGRKIKIPDAIIAATALAHSYTLVTRNTADFKNIPGLELLNPWDI